MDGTKVAKDATVVGGESSDGGLYFDAGKTFEAGSFFSGPIDDVQIYNEALTPDEIAEMAQ